MTMSITSATVIRRVRACLIVCAHGAQNSPRIVPSTLRKQLRTIDATGLVLRHCLERCVPSAAGGTSARYSKAVKTVFTTHVQRELEHPRADLSSLRRALPWMDVRNSYNHHTGSVHWFEAEERIARQAHATFANERLRDVERPSALGSEHRIGLRTQVVTRIVECAQQVRQQQARYICKRASASMLLQV